MSEILKVLATHQVKVEDSYREFFRVICKDIMLIENPTHNDVNKVTIGGSGVIYFNDSPIGGMKTSYIHPEGFADNKIRLVHEFTAFSFLTKELIWYIKNHKK